MVCEYSPAISQKIHIPKHRSIILWFKSILHEDFLYFFSECLMPLLYCSLLKGSFYDYFNFMWSSIHKSYYHIYWKKSNPNKQLEIEVNWEATAVSVDSVPQTTIIQTHKNISDPNSTNWPLRVLQCIWEKLIFMKASFSFL